MTTPSAAVATVVVTLVNIFIYVQALGGSATTLAVVYGDDPTICGIVANQKIQSIQCWKDGQSTSTPISPDVSFEFIAGGLDGFASVHSGGFSLHFWDRSLVPKRLYFSYSTLLTTLTMGDAHICAITNSTQTATCWRGDTSQQPNGPSQFISISSGSKFSCGVLDRLYKVVCWGNSDIASTIQSDFVNETMVNIYAGGRHACGVNTNGFLICKGDNKNGQLDVPSNNINEYSGIAMGMNHTCGIRRMDHTVACWGGNGAFSSNVTQSIAFEAVAAGLDYTCGVTTSNFSVVCWGPGWTSNMYPQGANLPLPMILPGPCVQSGCACGIYPESQYLCLGNGNICTPCDLSILPPPTEKMVVGV